MNEVKKHNSNGLLAIVLIVIGGLWLLRQLGFYIDFPNFHEIFYPFRNAFGKFWHLIFSWQIMLIIIGVVLLAAKNNSSGIVLIVIGGIFLLPKIFFIPGITFAILFPVLLIGIGVALIARKI